MARREQPREWAGTPEDRARACLRKLPPEFREPPPQDPGEHPDRYAARVQGWMRRRELYQREHRMSPMWQGRARIFLSTGGRLARWFDGDDW